MPDLAAAYEETRRNMIDLVRSLSPDEQAARVPACPDWNVKQLIAHVTSIASAIAQGRIPADLNLVAFWDADVAVRREEFVDTGLSERDERSLDEIIKEWEETAPLLESMMRGEQPWPGETPPFPEWIVLTDLSVHHHDLRGAIGRAGDRDSLATGLGLRSYVEGMRFRVAHEGLPTLRIRAGSREWVIGDGEPAATVTADPFELARAASGRRAWEQVRALDWDGDPEPFKALFYPYGARKEALVE
jgi:uncharacterized protein (TIGR03083 family)